MISPLNTCIMLQSDADTVTIQAASRGYTILQSFNPYALLGITVPFLAFHTTSFPLNKQSQQYLAPVCHSVSYSVNFVSLHSHLFYFSTFHQVLILKAYPISDLQRSLHHRAI